MSQSSFLFRWLGINWTLTKCLIVVGTFLVLLGAGLFIVLFKHVKGKAQRMGREEGWDFLMNAGLPRTDKNNIVLWAGPAVGVKAELNCNIDTLRNAARRGDWLTFWLWPIMLSCWSIGMFVLVGAVLPRKPIFIVLTALLPAFMMFVAWFMPWAAIYTNIDLNADGPSPAQPDDRPSPPKW